MSFGNIDRVSIGSGNGSLPDSTKLLPEQMSTDYQIFLAFAWEQLLLDLTRNMRSNDAFLKLFLVLPRACELMSQVMTPKYKEMMDHQTVYMSHSSVCIIFTRWKHYIINCTLAII